VAGTSRPVPQPLECNCAPLLRLWSDTTIPVTPTQKEMGVGPTGAVLLQSCYLYVPKYIFMQLSIFRENIMWSLKNQMLLQRSSIRFVRFGIKSSLKMVKMCRNMSEKLP
jgi:hypothetical protein